MNIFPPTYGVDEITDWKPLAQELAKSAQSDFHSIITVLFFAIICLTLFPPLPRGGKQCCLRVFLVTIIGWVAILWMRGSYELRWNLTVNDLKNEPDPMYDGVGGNAVILLLGWLPFFIGSSLLLGTVILIRRGIRAYRKRLRSSDATESRDEI